jgi:hypothetical protein
VFAEEIFVTVLSPQRKWLEDGNASSWADMKEVLRENRHSFASLAQRLLGWQLVASATGADPEDVVLVLFVEDAAGG